ncbi:hypothetical protein BUZ55_01680 [Staphylococcus hominis]|nr:hypothetical protein BUZ55_01680 [Staphylococcus hominis]
MNRASLQYKRKKDLLYLLTSDFSMNNFIIKLTFVELFKNIKFIVEDVENNYLVEIVSESIFSRLKKRISQFNKKGETNE